MKKNHLRKIKLGKVIFMNPPFDKKLYKSGLIDLLISTPMIFIKSVPLFLNLVRKHIFEISFGGTEHNF